MFSLTEDDLIKAVVSFGDGPASFNAEMRSLNNIVISLDVICEFSKKRIIK